jgi:hypothetical protein
MAAPECEINFLRVVDLDIPFFSSKKEPQGELHVTGKVLLRNGDYAK